MFIKLAQSSMAEDIGIEWCTVAPKTKVHTVVERSPAWTASVVQGMVLQGVKLFGERHFVPLDGTKQPCLEYPGTFPRIVVLKFRHDGICTVLHVCTISFVSSRMSA